MDLRTQLQDHLGTTFRLDRELGGGGMSRVFVAHEHRLSRNVVIKVLSPELVAGINAERFEREILLAASLQQANIVPVLAAGEVGGLPYFTMPFVEGESLRTRLTGQGLPIADVLAILRDVTKALAYAHARNIVHRDIKPDNVLLSGGTAVVTDFGIAKALSASRTGGVGATLTSVGTSIGTPAYMAPEQVAGDPNIDHRVDLYSLGCMAFELLTGRAPFADRTPQKMLAAHLSEAPRAVESMRPECPPALGRLVSQLLAKDPNDRPQQASEVLRTLDQATTTSSPQLSMTAPGMLPKALALYAVATGAVAVVAKAAVVGIGLPAWTFPGAVAIMLLGLPMLLFTAWVKRTARRAANATPTRTPGGSMASHGTMATIAIKANRHVSWRRTVRGGMYAMGGFVVLVTGFMVMRKLGIGPAASLFATGSLSAADKILLADFAASPEDSSLAPIVVEAVRAAMSQSEAVQMLTIGDVAQALEQMERAPTTPLTGDVAREVAARTNAKAILRGRLARAGSGYAVSLELADAGGSTILASMQGSAGDAQELIPVVDHLTRKLRGKIGEGLRQVARTVPLERATTASLEALRKFTEATQANDVEFNYDRAVAAGREAVRIDSTFALAWRKLAVALQNAGGSAAAIDSALERAAQFAEKLPPRERHLVMGGYYETHTIRNNRALALNEYRAVFGIDSLNSVAINQLAMLHSFRGDLDSALHYGRYYYRVRQGPNIRFRAVYGLVALGHVDSARSLLDSMRADDPAWIGSFAGSRMVRVVEYSSGNIEAVRASIAQSLQSPVLPLRLDALLHGAEVELVGGHLDSATALNRAAQELQLARGMPGFPSLAAAQADILYRDRAVVGIASLDSFVASGEWTAALKADRPYATVALLYALAGAPAKARQILAQYRIELPGVAESELSRGNTVTVEALIAIAEGRLPEAITLGRSILRERDGSAPPCRVCGPLALANAFDRMGQLDSATAWYEEYLRVPTIVRFFSGNDAYWLAKVRKRLGELYDQRGERAKAIEQYAALVEQWKDADAELQPAVASVRARLNELRGQEGT